MAGKSSKGMLDEQEIILNLSTTSKKPTFANLAYLKIQKLEGELNSDEVAKLAIQKQMVQLYLYEAVEKS